MLTCSSSQLMTSARGAGREIQFYLKGRLLRDWRHPSEYIDDTAGFFSYVSFLFLLLLFLVGNVTRVGGSRHGRPRKWVWLGFIIRNSQRINKNVRFKIRKIYRGTYHLLFNYNAYISVCIQVKWHFTSWDNNTFPRTIDYLKELPTWTMNYWTKT